MSVNGGPVGPEDEDEDETFVFISYTKFDQAWATWIAATLEGAGMTARVQAWDSAPGGDFVVWMNEQLARSRWTIAVYSAAYFASRWCTHEWTGALGRQTLLPVRVEPVDPPPDLSTIAWLDLYPLEEDAAREALLRAVGLRVLPRLAAFPGRRTTTYPGGTADETAAPVSNLVQGNVSGNVIQARDVSGGIVLGGGTSG